MRWPRIATALAAVAAVAATFSTPLAAQAETKSYAPASRYVEKVTFANNRGPVVVKVVAETSRRWVTRNWGVELDVDPHVTVPYGLPDLVLTSDWKRLSATRLYLNKSSGRQARVRCANLKVSRIANGRGRKVTIPRSCLTYVPTATKASKLRFHAFVGGDLRTRSGWTCWYAEAPRRWTPWLARGAANRRDSTRTTESTVARGC